MFKSLQVYDLKLNESIDLEVLENNLFKLLYNQRANAEMSCGFVPIKDNYDTLYHVQDGNLFLRVKIHQRKISKVKLEDAVSARLQELKALGEPVDDYNEAELADVHRGVYQSLLPTADYTNNYVVLVLNNYKESKDITLFVDNTSNKLVSIALDNLLTTLLSDNYVNLIRVTDNDIVNKLTNVVSKERYLVDPFALGNKVVMLNPDTKEKATVDKQDPQSEEVLKHIKSGKKVQELQLDYDGVIKFNLDKDYKFKGIKFSLELEGDDEDQVFESSLFYTVKELNDMLACLKNI